MAKLNKTQLLEAMRDLRRKGGLSDSDLRTLIQSLWRDPVNVEQVVNIEINNQTSIINQSVTNVIKGLQAEHHESYLIEDTVATEETQVSGWSVLPWAERVGLFKVTVMVRNKATYQFTTLCGILSFDNTDMQFYTGQSDLLTDPTMSLYMDIWGDEFLYARISGMPEDPKIIHWCFERCVLGTRKFPMSGTGYFNFTAAGLLTGSELLPGSGTAQLNLTVAALLAKRIAMGGAGDFALTANGALYKPATPGYGLLYNGYVHQDSRKITSSDDWRVMQQKISIPQPPSDWDILMGCDNEGYATGDTSGLKEEGTVFWSDPNVGATNLLGFSARGAGFRRSNGLYLYFGLSAVFGDGGSEYSWGGFTVINSINTTLSHWGGEGNNGGASIRLCNPSTLLSEGQTGTYTQNDGTVLGTIVINGIEYLSENLKETKWRTGELIDLVEDNTAWSLLETAAYCYVNGDPNTM